MHRVLPRGVPVTLCRVVMARALENLRGRIVCAGRAQVCVARALVLSTRGVRSRLSRARGVVHVALL